MSTSAVDISTPQSAVTLAIIVVGGSTAGLATALALQRAGHQVVVVDEGDGTSMSRGGMRSPPNGTRVFTHLGLLPSLQKLSIKCGDLMFELINDEKDEVLGGMALNQAYLEDYLVADFLLVKHCDLVKLLTDAGREAGVQFRYNAKVIKFLHESPESQVGVHMQVKNGIQGETTQDFIYGDFVVGADGYDSKLREIVVPDDDVPTGPDVKHIVVLAFTVPRAEIQADPELRKLLAKSTHWCDWLGNGYRMYGNFVDTDGDYGATIIYNVDDFNGDLKGISGWRQLATLQDLEVNLGRLGSTARKLLDNAQELFTIFLRARAGPTGLVCEKGKIALVGDAAHPFVPAFYLTAIALEDAQTLGTLFSRLRSRNHISRMLVAYESIRLPRLLSLKASDDPQHRLFTLPPGEERDIRDRGLTASLATADARTIDEEKWWREWAREMEITTFNTEESVEGWWRQFGGAFEEEGQRAKENLEVEVIIADRPASRAPGTPKREY